ncbi:toll/interleukin-1 receptor domain-containing protein [Acidobacteriota bacterium]
MIEWESLMDSLIDGDVVPVVGNDLSLLKGKNNKPTPLYEYIARQVTQEHEVPYNKQSIHELALFNQEIKIPNIHMKIRSLYNKIKRGNNFYTEPLEKLARITDFKFYISTSIDDILEETIKKERKFTDGELKIINYSPQMKSPGKSAGDIESKTTVFKLMGSLYELGNSAIDEEKMLEHFFTISWRGISDHPEVEYLIQEVRASEKIFLFIGCDFPDWFMRFVIRILTNRKLTAKISDYIVNSSNKQFPKLKNFLAHCGNYFEKIPNMNTDNAIAFVDQLYQKWLEIKRQDKNIQYEGTVFISYYNPKNLKDAENLKDSLKDECIKTWFDKENLESGEHKKIIRKNIRDCKVFVPIISDDILKAPESYARKIEWSIAEYIFEFNRKFDQQFNIIPCITDNTDRKDMRIPDFIKEFTSFNLRTDMAKILGEIKSKLKPVSEE